MGECEIRKAEAADATAMALLNRTALGYHYPAPETEKRVAAILADENQRIFVAVEGARLVGYLHAAMYEVTFAPLMVNVQAIAVHSDGRRRGIGKALMQQAEDWAKEIGAAGVRSIAGGHRKGSYAFYESNGFHSVSRNVSYQKDFEDNTHGLLTRSMD